MSEYELDEVDRGILHMLQKDARNNQASDIADAVGVSPNTVRNRIARLEEHDILQGYHPHIDYERAGYQLRVTFVCTVSVSERGRLADEALGIEGVVNVSEILSGHENLWIEAVGDSTDEISAIASELESLGLTIHGERFMKNTRLQPFDQFGKAEAEE